jgi:hypothetical protein
MHSIQIITTIPMSAYRITAKQCGSYKCKQFENIQQKYYSNMIHKDAGFSWDTRMHHGAASSGRRTYGPNLSRIWSWSTMAAIRILSSSGRPSRSPSMLLSMVAAAAAAAEGRRKLGFWGGWGNPRSISKFFFLSG